jgi:hypothetical protein
MNAVATTGTLAAGLAQLGARVSLPGGPELSKVTLGQFIKARVLRQYEGGRYLVALHGQERVVDSAVPLRTGEILHGRVVAIGDRIELERVDTDTQPSAPALQPPADAAAPPTTDGVQASFDRYRATLDPAGREVLQRALRGAQQPDSMLLAGVTLSKFGLPQHPVLLEALYRALNAAPAATPPLAARDPGAASSAPAAGQIREALQQKFSDQPAPIVLAERGGEQQIDNGESGTSAEQFSQNDPGAAAARLGRWMLNAQTGGAMAHRLGSVPLLVGGRLLEVEVALFEQSARGARPGDARHRRVVFVLETEHLGRVEVAAQLADSRVRIRVETQRTESTQFLARHADELKSALTGLGWSVDEIVYGTLPVDGGSVAVYAVVEHVIAQDSLNRLV